MKKQKMIKHLKKLPKEYPYYKLKITDKDSIRKMKRTVDYKDIKKLLLENKSAKEVYYYSRYDKYFPALFLVALTAPKESIKLKPILHSFSEYDTEEFYFFIRDILIFQNPSSIINSPLKTLITAIALKEV